MNTQHTPGPWGVRSKKDYEVYEGGDQPHTVCTASGYYIAGIRQNQCSEANARLIAAAPDLLAAAKLVMAWVERPCNHGGTNPYTYDFVQAAQDAIAKAEGR